MSAPWSGLGSLPDGPDFIGDHQRAHREHAARVAEAADRIWAESLPAFEADLAAHGYAGWDASLFLAYGAGGYPFASFTEHGKARDWGQWLPSAPYSGPSAKKMAEQFERWSLVEEAERLGLMGDAETLRQPCQEKGFERRQWSLAAERVKARAEDERDERETTARLADVAGDGIKNNPFAALAALKEVRL